MTYRHLAFDLFLPGIVNHSRIRGAVHYVKIDVRKQCSLVVAVLLVTVVSVTLDGVVEPLCSLLIFPFTYNTWMHRAQHCF